MGIISDFKRLFCVKKAVAKSAAEKAAEKGEAIGEDLSEAASRTWEKTKEVAEDIGEKISTKANEVKAEIWDKKDDWTPKEPVVESNPKTENTSNLGDKAEKTW